MNDQPSIEAVWTPPFNAVEDPRDRARRHEAHQAKMEAQKQAKTLARERHRAGWHKFKLLPSALY